MASRNSQTKDVVAQGFSHEELAGMESFDQVMALIKARDMTLVTEVPDIGDGFKEIDKAELVGVTCVLIHWEFRLGDVVNDDGEKTEYAGVRGMTTDGRKFYFSDGSTLGVAKQLRDITTQFGEAVTVALPRGLATFQTKKSTKPTYYIPTLD